MNTASEVLRFDHEVTGIRLIEAVKTIADRTGGGAHFTCLEVPESTDRYVVGQESPYACFQIAVGPSVDGLDIGLDETYTSCVVKSYQWPQGGIVMDLVSEENFRLAVEIFVEDLLDELSHPQPDTPEVWPQTVKVCVLCERIMLEEPGLYQGSPQVWRCPVHGVNPPSRQVQVILAPPPA